MIPVNVLKGVSGTEVRQLLVLRDARMKLGKLLEERERHVSQAEKIQRKIDGILRSWVDPSVQLVRPGRRGRGLRLGPTVKEMAAEVLKGRKEGLSAARVKDAILKKHPERDSATFYNQVFIALTRNPEFKRTKEKTYVLA